LRYVQVFLEFTAFFQTFFLEGFFKLRLTLNGSKRIKRRLIDRQSMRSALLGSSTYLLFAQSEVHSLCFSVASAFRCNSFRQFELIQARNPLPFLCARSNSETIRTRVSEIKEECDRPKFERFLLPFAANLLFPDHDENEQKQHCHKAR
jgi:hypothetical protein